MMSGGNPWRRSGSSISQYDDLGKEIFSIQLRKRKQPSKCRESGDRKRIAPPIKKKNIVSKTSTDHQINVLSTNTTDENNFQANPYISDKEELSDQTDLFAYKLEIARVQGLQPCSETGKFFWILDFNKEQKKLKEKNVIFIEPRKKTFSDETKMIYCCSSCDKFILSLSPFIQETYSEFIAKTDFCLHSRCAEFFLDEYFTEEVLEEFSEDIFEPLSPNITIVEVLDGICIKAEGGSYGILIASENRNYTEGSDGYLSSKDGTIVLQCISCKYNTHKCEHIDATRKLSPISEEQLLIEEILYRKSLNMKNYQRKLTPVSKSKIPYEAIQNSELRAIFEKDYHYFVNSLNYQNNIYVVEYTESQCSKCQKIIPEDKLEFSVVNLFLRSSVINCQVFHYVCICGTPFGLDGLEIGALNMGRYMVSHQILWDYHDAFVFARSSFYAYYEGLVARFQRTVNFKNIQQMLSYAQLKASWTHFLSLLDLNYKDGFKCSICLENPEIILCDGTTLGFKRKFLSWECTNFDAQELRNIPYTKFSERAFLKNPRTRKLLNNFVSSKNISNSDYQTLISNLKSENTDAASSLAHLLDAIVENSQSPSYPKKFKELLECLSKDSAVCATFPCGAPFIDLLEKLMTGYKIRQHPEDLKYLSLECPLLFNLIFSENNESVPPILLPLIRQICVKTQACFPQYHVSELTEDFVCSQDLSEISDKLACFPAISKKCKRGIFEADKISTVKSCEKVFAGKHSTLTPGIFTIYCEHGICYGFQALEKAESVNIPFSILRTRFYKSPRAIVYDFACGLHQYCLNRDPIFFKNTKFLIDRLHWKNHSGCSIGFCLDKYDQYKTLNTQINEQMNSALKKIKHILTFMNQQNFMSHCQLYLYSYNRRKKLKSQ